MGTAGKLIGGAVIVTSIWIVARADTRSPGTAKEGITSFADTAEAATSGGIRVIVNGSREATSILPDAPSETDPAVGATGGDESGTP